ncbi:MAG: SDR family oxidoreductase [bacterium]
MNILLTGTSGFLGRFILNDLHRQGHNIIAVSRSKHQLPKGVSFYQQDLTQDKLSLKIKEKIDLCIHLAAANEIDCQDAKQALMVNAWGTKQCLELAHQAGAKRFIYFSTMRVYKAQAGMISLDNEIDCTDDYGLTHYYAEHYVRAYQDRMNTVIIRPSNVFGSPDDLSIDRWSLVPGCFCKEAVEKGSITLRSSGKQTRDFLPIKQLLKYINALIVQRPTEPQQCFNMASGTSMTIEEVAKIVQKAYEIESGKTCQIDIQSKEPKEASAISIDIKELNKLAVTSLTQEEVKEAMLQSCREVIKNLQTAKNETWTDV